VRTFAPFVAGIGKMSYARFGLFNVVGALLWTGLLLPLGYVFADTEIVKKRFELVIFAIIGISILPMVIEILRERAKGKSVAAAYRATRFARVRWGFVPPKRKAFAWTFTAARRRRGAHGLERSRGTEGRNRSFCNSGCISAAPPPYRTFPRDTLRVQRPRRRPMPARRRLTRSRTAATCVASIPPIPQRQTA
jgi:hypothetical protein